LGNFGEPLHPRNPFNERKNDVQTEALVAFYQIDYRAFALDQQTRCYNVVKVGISGLFPLYTVLQLLLLCGI
jgi:hypothetical protein